MTMSDQSSSSPIAAAAASTDEDPHDALTKCLCSQYALTFTTVSLATAYSVYRRPKNGLAIMLMAGATATVVEFLYAYTVTCSDQVRKSNEYYQQQKLLEPSKVQQLPPSMAGHPDDNLPR